MKIFISWSGDLSKGVALAFRDWLKLVIHGAESFVSEEDIDKGTRPLARIGEELEGTDCGILCITRKNLDRPWVSYEAGALSKKVGDSRVMPFLIDLEHGDIPQHNPLSQFQTTSNNKADILRMVRSLNSAVKPPVSEVAVVERLFEAVWEDLERPLQVALTAAEQEPGTTPAPALGVMVGEILDLTRSQQRMIDNLRSDIRTLATYQMRLHWRDEVRPRFRSSADLRYAIDTSVNELSRQLGRRPTVEEVAAELRIDVLDLVSIDLGLDRNTWTDLKPTQSSEGSLPDAPAKVSED